MGGSRIMPEVSVVIPAFNAARFLPDALESVFQQTFTDYEVVVVDDGSTDDTAQLVNRYGNRMRYFFQENAGVSRARNRGIRESAGKYIAFLDADDVWLPTKLARQVERFRQRPALGMVFTDGVSFNEQGVLRGSKIKWRRRLAKRDLIRAIFLYSGVGTPTVMVRRDVFDRVGYFDETLDLA